MSLIKKLAPLVVGSIVTPVLAQPLYDNFNSGILNPTLWEIRQDTEGQPLMQEYGVRNENGNFVFHTQQNDPTDRRVYLYPARSFTTGDIVEYDTNLTSSSGTYAQMTLLTGDHYYRLGMRGPAAGFDELGLSHARIEFAPNALLIERTTPSGNVLFDTLPLSVTNGTYQMYIGSLTGHDGTAHLDFDNFAMGQIPSPSAFGLLGLAGLVSSRRRR